MKNEEHPTEGSAELELCSRNLSLSERQCARSCSRVPTSGVPPSGNWPRELPRAECSESKAAPLLSSPSGDVAAARVEPIVLELPAAPPQRARIHWYVAAEGLYVLYQLLMCALLAQAGLSQAALANAVSPVAVGWLCLFYGDV